MANQSTQPQIVRLAQTISASVDELQEILIAQNAEFPSFEEGAPESIPQSASKARNAILEATAELHDLLLEPSAALFIAGSHTNMVCMQAITRFRIPAMIPAHGQMSYEEISQRTCMSESVTRRLLQYAMMMRVFREPRPGMVAHTKLSKILVDPKMNDWMSTGAEDGWPAAVRMVDALEKWPKSQEPNESGFALANNTTDSIYSIIGADPERAQRFARSMEASTSNFGYDSVHAVENYGWDSLGAATVVDVGGAQGHISFALATRFRNLNFVVQDIEAVVDSAESKIPRDLQGRVRFEAHDFFQPQKTHGDVYFFRWIFHNHSDKYAIRILRALIPVLNQGSRIVIMDFCMKEKGQIPLWREKVMRMADITMGALMNAGERTYDEWKLLVQEADPRFKFKQLIDPEGSAMSLMDIRWNAVE